MKHSVRLVLLVSRSLSVLIGMKSGMQVVFASLIIYPQYLIR
ncbi:hypothetical protein [Photobacterium halotolerans]|nr:hypothetical protein [Photobacterium halotolerans]